jgi:hypothetical protein
MSKSLILSRVNPPYINRNIYLKLQFVGLPTPNGDTIPFGIKGMNMSKTISYNKNIRRDENGYSHSHRQTNGISEPSYYKDPTGQEYVIFVLNTDTKINVEIQIYYKDELTSIELTSNTLTIDIIDPPIGSPSVSELEYVEPSISASSIKNGKINTPTEIYLNLTNITKLISINRSDGSSTPIINVEKKNLDSVITVTNTTLGPVTYTITGNSELGIITSNPITITFEKPFTIPICSNLPGVLITISSDELFTKYKKFTGLNINNGKEYLLSLKEYNNRGYGLPHITESYAYLMAAHLLFHYGVSSSRICDAKTTPDIIDMTDASNATLSFILTDRITPDNNLPIFPFMNNNKSNDYLSCFCIAKWIEYDIKNTDKFTGIFINMITNDRLPVNLLSSSCPAFNSPSLEHFNGPQPPDVGPNDVIFTYSPSVSTSNSTSNSTSSSTSDSSEFSNTIIIVVVVVVVTILAVVAYYYMTMKSRNYELTAGRFEIGE